MNDDIQSNSFVLLDAAMMDGISKYIPGARETLPPWLMPVYKDKAAEFGPFVIDMEMADQAGDGGVLKEMLCAMMPRLHFSLIDTALSQTALTEHLRKFIFFALEDTAHYVLRFADCRVLPALAATLLPEQWAAMTTPFTRWQVRGRDGKLFNLPMADANVKPITPPLIFSESQVDVLTDATEPDQLIFNIKATYPTQNFLGSAADHYQWAKRSIALWKSAGCTDRGQLLELVARAFQSMGAVLDAPELPGVLARRAAKRLPE